MKNPCPTLSSFPRCKPLAGAAAAPAIALTLLLAGPAHAIITCELNGAHINTSDGNSTAGKTGMVRCKDADTGQLQREQELKDGKYLGLVRFYNQGVLLKEHRVNEQGNREGLAREFAGKPGANNPIVLEENLRNGTVVGRVRTWHAQGGALRSVALHDDKGQEQASAEFTPQGKLRGLRCGTQPLLAPDADDARWCGHGGQPGNVELFNDRGELSGRVSHERGERRRFEALWGNGKPRITEETSREGGSEKRYAEDGNLRSEKQWAGTGRERRTTLEREHFESGRVALERRFRPMAQDASRFELATEQTWYQNGQPKLKQEYGPAGVNSAPGLRERSDTGWHDNGKLAFQGRWRIESRYRETALGIHKAYHDNGQLRSEQHHDERGRLTRERSFNEAGALLRDGEVYPDGSRKQFAK